VPQALRLASRLGRYGLALLVGVIALGYGAVFAFRLEPMTMLTGSMGESIPAGSLVLTRSVPPSSLRVGDVITFEKPRGAPGLDTHRIIRIEDSNGHTTYRTKGDANSVEDPWVLEFGHGQTGHRVEASVPHLGRLFAWFRSPVWAFGLASAIALMLLSTVVKALAAGARGDAHPHEVEQPSATA
jgi:signal peptidase